MLNFLKIYKTYRCRKFFDEEFYRSQYPDINTQGIDAFSHYMTHGWKEGRNPCRYFNSLLYKDHYLSSRPDINPFEHYASRPKYERQRVAATLSNEAVSIQAKVIETHFDAAFYREIYGLRDEADPLRHYLTQGWLMGYEPTMTFSSEEHVKRHPHIARMGLPPFYHLISTQTLCGTDFSHEPAPDYSNTDLSYASRGVVLWVLSREFDHDYYMSTHHDVREAGANPLEHYVDFGWREGRNPRPSFWTKHYVDRYMDSQNTDVNPFFHYLIIGRREGLLPNPFGYREWPKVTAPAAADWAAVSSALDLDAAEVAVILPVYNGYDETLRAIHAVLSNGQRTGFALIVVDDCGPDPELRSMLRQLASQRLFILLENSHNFGFVRSVNRAVEICRGKNIILLNSDAVPFGDWIDRLVAHAESNADAATITPLSNNATICSFPQPNINNLMQLEATPAQLDAYARECNAGMSVDIPTAVGFCFYIRDEAISDVGTFDADTFGRGYGEENDFCMRAKYAGYRHLLAYDIFVYHKGSVSFDATYINNIAAIEQRLHTKHPDYPSNVRQYVAADPGREGRIRLDLFRIVKHLGRRSVVFVSHSEGGGIETHVKAMTAQLAEEGIGVVLITVSSRHQISVAVSPLDARSVLTYNCSDLHVLRYASLIEQFLEWLQPLFVHVHSLVGLEWQATQRMMSIVSQKSQKYYFTLHDYSPVCHRNHLVKPTGVYCGLAAVHTCRSCLAIDHDELDCIAPATRRAVYAAFLAGAEAVFAPSHDIAVRVAPLLPGSRIVVRPHHENLPVRPLPMRPERPRGTPVRVAALGAIGPHKGINILYSLALDANLRQLPIEYVVIGYSSMSNELSKLGVTETGKYNNPEHALTLIDQSDIDAILIPSIWPETYCYTLSIALSSGRPPIAFDIGAPAERLRATHQGLLIDIGDIERPQKINDCIATMPLDAMYSRRKKYMPLGYDSMLRHYYGGHEQSQAVPVPLREADDVPHAT